MKTITCILFMAALMFTMSSPILAQWEQTNGPYGGSVTSFAVSGTNLFAGTYYGGVFLSTNNGTSWTAVNASMSCGFKLFDSSSRFIPDNAESRSLADEMRLSISDKVKLYKQ